MRSQSNGIGSADIPGHLDAAQLLPKTTSSYARFACIGNGARLSTRHAAR